MRESVIQKQIIDWLREQGAYVVNIHGGPMQEAGVPDVLACYKGHFIGIEVKVPGEQPSDLQEYHLQQIALSGGASFCVTSLDEAKDAIRMIQAMSLVAPHEA